MTAGRRKTAKTSPAVRPLPLVRAAPNPELLNKMKKHSSHIEFEFPPKQGTGLVKLIPHASPDALDLMHLLLAYNPEDRAWGPSSAPAQSDFPADLSSEPDCTTGQGIIANVWLSLKFGSVGEFRAKKSPKWRWHMQERVEFGF